MGPSANLAQRQSLAPRGALAHARAHTHTHTRAHTHTHPHTHTSTDGTEPSLGSAHSDWMNHGIFELVWDELEELGSSP